MTAANVSFAGANLGVDSTETEQRALYLKEFAGEVLTAYEKETVMLTRHYVRTVPKGQKSAQFPVIGRMPAAEYHTPGAEILGQDVKKTEVIIPIDRLLISHIFVDDLDDMLSHFEVRSKYSQMMGAELAQTFDNHVFREALLGAAASANIANETGTPYSLDDDNLNSATAATKLAAWVDGIFAAAAAFDTNFVPRDRRYIAMTPAYYYFLVKTVGTNGQSVIDRDYGGEGSYADGKVNKIAGIELISTPMLPTADYSAEDYHAVNAANTVGIVWHPDAVGTTKLMDISIQSAWDIRRQGTLMVARYAMGHKYLRPEAVGRFFLSP